MKEDHPKINFGKTGVLIINLGTPDSTKWWDIRKYLKEFLSDKRVIEVNPIIWQIILNLFILTFRPSKTAKAYKEIWMNDLNKSPLRYYTEMQTEKLSKKISKSRSNIANHIRLLKLPIEIQSGVKSKKISMGHARALISIDNHNKKINLFEETLNRTKNSNFAKPIIISNKNHRLMSVTTMLLRMQRQPQN